MVLPDDWLQGRTAFGGLSAALCWEAAQRVGDALPPLRSAQFAFVGPAGGRLRIEPTLLRRGKSAAFYSVDLHGDDVLAVHLGRMIERSTITREGRRIRSSRILGLSTQLGVTGVRVDEALFESVEFQTEL